MSIVTASPTWKRLIVVLLMMFAALQFIRSYFIINKPYLNEGSYEAGLERMPFQGRILMAHVAKASGHSAIFRDIASHMRGPLHEPSTLAIAVVGLLSLLVAAMTIRSWYRVLSPGGPLQWVPFTLFLWMIYATYLARFQGATYLPYDLVSLAIFTLALYLCFTERYLYLAILLTIACFNRETIIVVLVPLGMNGWLHLRAIPRRFPIRELIVGCLFIGVWLAVRVHYSHVFAGNPTELHGRWRENLGFLGTPQTWSQILSGAGFLMPVPFLWFWSMPDVRMRAYSSIILVWIGAMFFFGVLAENRIFGELIGFLAVYCTIQFEDFVRRSDLGARNDV